MKLFTEPNDSLGTINQSIRDEIAVAGLHESMAKIVITVRIALRILDGAPADPDHLRAIKWLQWIQTRIQAGEADHNFENGSRRIGHARGTIDLRPEVLVLELCVLFVAHAADVAVWVEARARGHGQNVSGSGVHHHCGAANWPAIGSGGGAQSLFGRFLDHSINSQHDVFTRLGRRPDGFRLAVAEAVHEY